MTRMIILVSYVYSASAVPVAVHVQHANFRLARRPTIDINNSTN